MQARNQNNCNRLAKTLPPSRKKVVVGALNSISDVRDELARLYRSARKHAGNELDASVATKLAYLLQCIGRSLEGSELEKRIHELERRLESTK
jgi:hypothetical protein